MFTRKRIGAIAALSIAVVVGVPLIMEAASCYPAPESESQGSIDRAIKFEEMGLNAQRSQAVRDILSKDASHSLANWMEGRVRADHDWQFVDRYELPENANYDRYLKERSKIKYTGEAHKKLAKWCKGHGLMQEAYSHLRVAEHLLPGDPEINKLLGKKSHGGIWYTDAEWQEAKKKASLNERAGKEWTKILREQSLQESKGDFARKTAARAFFNSIRDPFAISILEELYSLKSADGAVETVKVIGQIPHDRATQSLVDHALYSQWEEARQLAWGTLKERPMTSVIPLLLDRLQPVNEQRASTVNRPKRYSSTEEFASNLTPPSDKATIERRAFQLLRELTAQKLPDQSGDWESWWAKQTDQYFDFSDPTNFAAGDDYAPPDERKVATGSPTALAIPITASCFAPDTVVWTRRGASKIGKLLPGDLVASINTETGELAFRPIVARTIVPPVSTVAISVGKDVIQSTLPHPFWVCGKGWVTAKHLKQGDVVRCLSTLEKVEKVEEGKRSLMYNLIVADNANYFVGSSKVLVHDNSPIRDNGISVPGLRSLDRAGAGAKVAASK